MATAKKAEKLAQLGVFEELTLLSQKDLEREIPKIFNEPHVRISHEGEVSIDHILDYLYSNGGHVPGSTTMLFQALASLEERGVIEASLWTPQDPRGYTGPPSIFYRLKR